MPDYARYPSLVDRCVFVSGGATGIGASLVEHFTAQGAQVAFVDIDAGAGSALAARLAGARHAPLFVEADVCDIAALERAIEAAHGHFGPVRVLLNNAANDRRHEVDATTPETWDAGIAVNLKHQFFAARAVAADMRRAGGGSIVNFGSVSWMLKQANLPVYATAKAAVQGLTHSLARELGPLGIRVNTLVPGWVMTDRQLRLWVDDAARAEIARGQCINRPVLPEHVAQMALFLAADDSAMCTGQEYIVDGGWV
ncbi:SDR family NAD(P)-dependent oxidoreductase [Caldimonas tepidiphila]|uniref:SDR family NAD(P)-dependent oxidoreductase n=1 Tax=Caldimonas tepidiphila TaxID=2315841 RepID=UPI000E5A8D9E|nr:SDR family oxidoreductase [Caldimonas tepidiphila]